jgi:uncharacterized protein YdiU (UPF0061 family)
MYNDSTTELKKYISLLLALSPETDRMDHTKASSDWMAWLEKYAHRIRSEADQWKGDLDLEREKAAMAVNPRFVLRQWVLEEVIKKVENDQAGGKRILGKVMKVGNLCMVSITIT